MYNMYYKLRSFHFLVRNKQCSSLETKAPFFSQKKALYSISIIHTSQEHLQLQTRRTEWAGIAQSVQRLATGWTVRRSNPLGGEIVCNRARPALGPTQPPIPRIQGLSPGVKQAGRDVDHPSPSSAEVEEREGLYLYASFGSSWPVLGRNLPLLGVQKIEHHNTILQFGLY